MEEEGLVEVKERFTRFATHAAACLEAFGTLRNALPPGLRELQRAEGALACEDSFIAEQLEDGAEHVRITFHLLLSIPSYYAFIPNERKDEPRDDKLPYVEIGVTFLLDELEELEGRQVYRLLPEGWEAEVLAPDPCDSATRLAELSYTFEEVEAFLKAMITFYLEEKQAPVKTVPLSEEVFRV